MPRRNITDQLADRFTTRGIRLGNFDAELRRKVRRILRATEADIIARLIRMDPSDVRRPSFRARRLQVLHEQVEHILRFNYRRAHVETQRELRGLAEAESAFTRESIRKSIGMDLFTVAVPPATLRSLASDVMIQGAPSRDWWASQSRRTGQRFVQQMRIGMTSGETIDQLVQRVRGTKAAGYTDGIMATSRREAEALVRTSVQAVAQDARLETYRANSDVIEGVQAVVTLDERTTFLCMSRSGGAWNVETGEPLEDSAVDEPFPGPPPWHWNCRSQLVPVLRSIEQMIADADIGPVKTRGLDRLPRATQASMNGQVAATLTFEDWLATKSDAFADRVLGPGRAELWRAGDITLAELVDQSGRPRRLDELAA